MNSFHDPTVQDYFIWITGEGKVVKNLSARFATEAFDQQLVRAAAYWHQRRNVN
jgi:ferric-chelate reductase (NADPH)